MADIVVLYRSLDRGSVQEIVDWLIANEWSVWWDQDHVEGAWSPEVERQIRACKFVLPVWSEASRAEESNVPHEVNFAKERDKPRLHIRIEDTPLPIFVSLETRTDFFEGDGYEQLGARIRTTLNQAQACRPPTLICGSKEFPLPAFVRSISSFETMANTVNAMVALGQHPSNAPILISAFDFHGKGGGGEGVHRRNEIIKELNERDCMMFMDSGNYEAYRKGLGQDQRGSKKDKWLPEDFYSTLSGRRAIDFHFSFDWPSRTGDDDEVVARTIGACQEPQLIGKRPIPIVHAPRYDNGERDLSALPAVVRRVADSLDCSIIAVPERELGEGIYERVRMVRRIRTELNECGKYRLLHLLGTGNPLSILMLAAAGADLFDGLEWCRTAADPATGRLHHSQHFDLFKDHMEFSAHEAVHDVYLNEDNEHPFDIQLMVHNLDFFETWMNEVRDRIEASDSVGMLANYMQESSSEEAVRVFETALNGDL